MKTICLILGVVVLTGCSHLGKQVSLDNHELSAVAKTDQAVKKIASREGDYNREVAFDLSLPVTPQTLKAANELLTLQYSLTGPATTPETTRDAFVEVLIKDNAQTKKELADAQQSNVKMLDQFATMKKDRNDWITRANTYALSGAMAWDKNDELWDCVYAFIALGFVVLVLWAIARFGSDAAAVAAKVP